MVSEPLTVGLAFTERVVVTPEMSPAHLGSIVVLSTPDMISLMEQAATQAVQPLLEPASRTTVGTHVDVSHESAAREGEEVEVTATVAAIDGPRLNFDVVARVGDRVIGRGAHRRHIVDRSRFGA